MPAFPTYDAAASHSEAIRQTDTAAAHAIHAAAPAGDADAYQVLCAATALATTQHHDRLDAAGAAFRVRNASPGNGQAAHAANWLTTGLAPAPADLAEPDDIAAVVKQVERFVASQTAP